MVVCINKIDAPTVTPEVLARVRGELEEFVALENVPVIEISAKSKLRCFCLNLMLCDTYYSLFFSFLINFPL